MIDAHHVGPVLAVTDLVYTDSPAAHHDRLVTNPDRRLDELVRQCLVRGVPGEIVSIDLVDLLAPVTVDIDANDDVALPLDGRICHRDNVAQEIPCRRVSVLGATELDAGRRRCRLDDFCEALHRLLAF